MFKSILDGLRLLAPVIVGLCLGFTVIGVCTCMGLTALFQAQGDSERQVSETQTAGELSILDNYLDGSKPSPSRTISAQQLAPDRIGQFKVDQQSWNRCGRSASGEYCEVVYIRGSLSIEVTVQTLPKGFPDSTNNWEGFSCGAEIGGKRLIHTVGKISYFYYVCHNALFSGSYDLAGVMWANGEWLFTAHGNFNELKEFLAAYPY